METKNIFYLRNRQHSYTPKLILDTMYMLGYTLFKEYWERNQQDVQEGNSTKKVGNSQGIRIGKDELEALGEDSTQLTFEMIIENGKMILTPKKNVPATLNELFADYEEEPLSEEDKFDWGDPVGRELL